MITFPNAKINIGLHVTAKRQDGYHNIESVFYPIPCKDALEFVPSLSTRFVSSGISIPGNEESNLCLKALKLIRKEFSRVEDLKIHLHKMIPMGGGLGGGSADGAFMINMLNEYYHLGLSVAEREAYAATLGSDCPFFIENKTAFVHGRGEHTEKINLNLSGWWLVLVFPGIHVSTADAFKNIKPHEASIDLRLISDLNVEDWKYKVRNQFEDSVFIQFPEIELIKKELYNFGATYATMTGSGSSVYGLFKEEPELLNSKFLKDYRTYLL